MPEFLWDFWDLCWEGPIYARSGRLGHIARGNARQSAVRARVEHVFAHQKERMGLCVRTVGLAWARTKIGLANLAYNFQRLVFHEGRAATA